MKIAFVQNLLVPYLGIMYISAALKQNGYETDVFIENQHKDIVNDICKSKPDIIGFVCMTGEQDWVKQRAKKIKEKLSVPIIVGGPHPTYFPKMVEADNIDIICRGEGEMVVLELMKKLEKKEKIINIKGLWFKQNGRIYKNDLAPLVENLDELSFPDRDIYNKYEHFRKETEIGVCLERGCPFNCTFCYNKIKRELYRGQKVIRKRSVDNIIEEIKFLQKKCPQMTVILFTDDNLGLDAEWLDELLVRYKEINAPPFVASIRIDCIDNARAKKLKEANCYALAIGLESGNSEMRNKVLNKNIQDETYYRTAKILKKNGIKLRVLNMFWLPGETIEMAFETLKMNKKMKADYAWVYPLQPYPQTEIYKYSIEHGYLDKDFSFDDIDPLGLLESPIKLKDGNKIKVLHRLFHYGLKIPGFYYLLKILVYIPNNPIFNILYKISLLWNYKSFHKITLFYALRIVLQANKRK